MLTESDIIITDESYHEEIFVTGSITFSAIIKTTKKHRALLDKQIKQRLIDELNWKIWGNKNKDLREWIIQSQQELLSIMPHTHEQYLAQKKFFHDLLNKI